MRTSVLLASTALLLGAADLQASANSIPFNETVAFSYNPSATGLNYSAPCCDYINNIVTSPLAASETNYSQSGDWGSVGAYAKADLATGTLKMQASASSNMNSGFYPSIQSNAIFGDSFTTTTSGGSPFVWNGSTATFNMALTGPNLMTSSDGFASAGGFIVLAILKKGTLDPNQPLIGSANGIEYFEYNIGNPNLQIYYTDQQGNSTPLAITAGYTDIPSEISATFAPGGDFDWALLLGASGQESPGEAFDIDFSHTLTLDYVAPEGTDTTSVSGQFTNIAAAAALPVPEPLTISTFAAGLAGLFAARRRKKNTPCLEASTAAA